MKTKLTIDEIDRLIRDGHARGLHAFMILRMLKDAEAALHAPHEPFCPFIIREAAKARGLILG